MFSTWNIVCISWTDGDITERRGFITWNAVSIIWNVAVAAGWGVFISPQFAGITAVVAAMTGQPVDRTGHVGGREKGEVWGARGDAASGVDVVQPARGDGGETWVVVRKAEGGPRSERAAEDFAKRAGRSGVAGRGAENPDSSSEG